MEIVNPSPPPLWTAEAQPGDWNVNLRGQTLGVLWNGKANADNLFRVIESRLRAKYGLGSSVWHNKSAEARGMSFPATEEILSSILTSGAVAVLTGSGD